MSESAGEIVLTVGPPVADGIDLACHIRIEWCREGRTEDLVAFGVDGVQAMLAALTMAGDYLRHKVTDLGFFAAGYPGLPVTDLSTSGVSRVVITIPTKPPGAP